MIVNLLLSDIATLFHLNSVSAKAIYHECYIYTEAILLLG